MRGLAKSQSSAIADEPGSYWGHLLPMPESSDLSLMTDKVGKGWFSMLCQRVERMWRMAYVARQSKPCPLRQSSLTDAGELHPSEAASGNYDVWQTNCC